MNNDLSPIAKSLFGSTTGSSLSTQAKSIFKGITGIEEDFKLGDMILIDYYDYNSVSSSANHTFNNAYTGDEFIMALIKPKSDSEVELHLMPIMSSAGTAYGSTWSYQTNASNEHVKVTAKYTNSNIITNINRVSWCRLLVVRIPGLLTS